MKQALICLALIQRNFKVFQKKFIDTCINATILVCSQVLVFGYLFPLLGMPIAFSGPIYLGSIIFFLIHYGFVFGLTLQFDLKGNRLIDYQLTLPLKKKWLFLSYVVSFVLETSIMIIPMLIGGIILLGNRFGPIHLSPFICMLSFLATMFFIGTFFLGLALYYSYEWYSLNVWPRRLSILQGVSAAFLIWKQLHAYAPKISYLVLINPLTHMAESLRASLLDPERFLPWYLTIPTLAFFIILCMILITIASNKRLDPV